MHINSIRSNQITAKTDIVPNDVNYKTQLVMTRKKTRLLLLFPIKLPEVD